ncbi:MAG: Undecaprenyl-phosphate galactose phosphotransferase, WbaP/exopolysaccharide biosynthesis polyprenyl, partial [Phycisphaerales bacterium]|nr:Undecaprenyl-phosphate galactose phosphotransferase, WbaP/exopolysaccharide biosynthesis polyprenyl [Phycisphaerales bacterium]
HAVVEFRQLTRVATVVCLTTVLLAALAGLPFGWVLFLAAAWPVQVAATPVLRCLVRRWASRYRWWGYPTLVFGSVDAARGVIESLNASRETGLRPVGVLDPAARPDDRRSVLGVPVLGTPRRAPGLVRALGVHYGIVALPDLRGPEVTRIVSRYAARIPHVLVTSAIAPVAHGLPSLWRDVRDCGGVVGVEVRNRLLERVPKIVKRGTDLALCAAAAVVVLPLAAALAVLVKLTSPGPIFYGDDRIGMRGRPFRAWKFRTMSRDAQALLRRHLAEDPAARAEYEREKKLRNDPRITRLGRLLRSTSLDELPQLWNVVRGEMSLVGPRPILPDEVAKYGRVYQHYKGVRPGITGLWQVSGRNDTTYDERLHLVNYYVRNWSPWLDLHIIARTFAALVFRRGAY